RNYRPARVQYRPPMRPHNTGSIRSDLSSWGKHKEALRQGYASNSTLFEDWRSRLWGSKSFWYARDLPAYIEPMAPSGDVWQDQRDFVRKVITTRDKHAVASI